MFYLVCLKKVGPETHLEEIFVRDINSLPHKTHWNLFKRNLPVGQRYQSLTIFTYIHDRVIFLPPRLLVINPPHHQRRSEQWRGEEGERRKVTVYEYTWNEDDATHEVRLRADLGPNIGMNRREKGATATKGDVTTHVSIHTLHLDGFRELYRQFLRWGHTVHQIPPWWEKNT